MIKYIYTCDKCGKTATADSKLENVGISCYDADHYLCDSCRTELQRLIYHFLNDKENRCVKNEDSN